MPVSGMESRSTHISVHTLWTISIGSTNKNSLLLGDLPISGVNVPRPRLEVEDVMEILTGFLRERGRGRGREREGKE